MAATAQRDHRLAPTSAEPAPPCTLVIFGAGGDLTKRLLMPSLYNLVGAKLLDERFAVLGIDHNERSDDDFRAALTEAMRGFTDGKGGGEFSADRLDAAAWGWLCERLFYLTGDFEDPAAYQALARRLAELERSHGTGGEVVFYLATAPRFFGPVIEHLAAAGLTRKEGDAKCRVIVEKPFGRDLASAIELNRRILAKLDERQVYRIDHFLGKETVQNIMALRFGNGIFEPLWNRSHIDHVQITAAETVGVEGRARFYEEAGALRDMVPNHLFQLLAMTAMEAPNSFDADAVRSEKAKVIEAIRDLTLEEALRDSVRGQYRAGSVGGRSVQAYREEPDVAPGSTTETYVALKLMIDNWRWAGVPFYLRTGKAMRARRTEVAIQFKRIPCSLFSTLPGKSEALSPNLLVLHVQPEEGISLRFEAKVPGPKVRLSGVEMDFRYKDYFQLRPNTGYETLLYDCLTGDPTLFQRADNVEAGWRNVQPFLDAWAGGGGEVHGYEAGGWGPEAAVALLARDGRHWLNEP